MLTSASRTDPAEGGPCRAAPAGVGRWTASRRRRRTDRARRGRAAEAGLELRAMVLHLLGAPAAADAEVEAAVGEEIGAGHGLRRRDRVALDDQADAGPHAQVLGGGGGGHQSDEGIERVLVLLG